MKKLRLQINNVVSHGLCHSKSLFKLIQKQLGNCINIFNWIGICSAWSMLKPSQLLSHLPDNHVVKTKTDQKVMMRFYQMWAEKGSSEYLSTARTQFMSTHLGKVERANCAGYETALMSFDIVGTVNLQKHRKYCPVLSQPPTTQQLRIWSESRHKGKKYKK